MTEHEKQEPTIIDILDDELKKGANDPDNIPSVATIAERMGVDQLTLKLWLESDREFAKGLYTIKEIHNTDPWKDSLDDEVKLDAATLSFGIVVILEETKKRYTA